MKERGVINPLTALLHTVLHRMSVAPSPLSWFSDKQPQLVQVLKKLERGGNEGERGN
jgi:hypothetical protein